MKKLKLSVETGQVQVDPECNQLNAINFLLWVILERSMEFLGHTTHHIPNDRLTSRRGHSMTDIMDYMSKNKQALLKCSDHRLLRPTNRPSPRNSKRQHCDQ